MFAPPDIDRQAFSKEVWRGALLISERVIFADLNRREHG